MFQNFVLVKLNHSTDEVMRLMCNYYVMVTKYRLFKNSVSAGDSVTAEKVYNDYIPTLIYLGKHTYYNLLLNQIDQQYNRIPYHVLQWICENRFQKFLPLVYPNLGGPTKIPLYSLP